MTTAKQLTLTAKMAMETFHCRGSFVNKILFQDRTELKIGNHNMEQKLPRLAMNLQAAELDLISSGTKKKALITISKLIPDILMAEIISE